MLYGWRALDERLHQRALAGTAATYAALHGNPLTRPAWRGARVLATTVALGWYAALLLCLLAAGWLATRDFPGLPLALGLLLAVAALGAWPRSPRLPRYADVLRPAGAPALYRLIGDVAGAVGAPPPAVVCLDSGFAADSGTHGLLRRRHLVIGLPLWMALQPAQRVALLAQQLARFADGDPRRGWPIEPVDTVVARVAAIFGPRRATTIQAVRDPRVVAAVAGGPAHQASSTQALVWLTELILMPVLALLRGWLAAVRLTLVGVPQRDTQQAEYFADALAARAAGTAASTTVLDLLLTAEPALTVLRSRARTGAPPASWPGLAAGVLADGAQRLPARRELSIRREVSPFAAHPPLGMRVQMIESGPPESGTVAPDSAATARVDAELRRFYERTSRELAHGG